MEILKSVSSFLKKVAAITTILAIVTETLKFFNSRVEEELKKGEQKNETN